MKVFTSVKKLNIEIEALKVRGLIVGFVPTMGALHNGHMALISRAKSECDICICSIFVNPKQFNEEKDFKVYPRQVKTDLELLERHNCDIVFTPEVDEIFPESITSTYDFGMISKLFEGKHRPGHFDGVAAVVKRFFEIIQPAKAYFGKKDYQQLMVIKALVMTYNFPIEIVGCEIIREKSGLAMSSRNSLLSLSNKEQALKLSATLFKISVLKNQLNISELIEIARFDLNADPDIRLEYFDIVDSENLMPINENTELAVALVAARVGMVRLIDNLTFVL